MTVQRPVKGAGLRAPLSANSNTRVTAGRLVASRRPAAGAGLWQASNSNTRLSVGLPPRDERLSAGRAAGVQSFDGLRSRMIERLRDTGQVQARVLEAMNRVPRHAFVDEALASRAYEPDALPIGAGQTISQPRTVGYMLSLACGERRPSRVLEVGTGCGYQAAVLAELADAVYSVERIRALHDLARGHMAALGLSRVRLRLGDGREGWPDAAPFDAIVVACAGLEIPQTLLAQLAPGGRLIAPEGGAAQRLILIERQGAQRWIRTELEDVRFVPLQTGVQL